MSEALQRSFPLLTYAHARTCESARILRILRLLPLFYRGARSQVAELVASRLMHTTHCKEHGAHPQSCPNRLCRSRLPSWWNHSCTGPASRLSFWSHGAWTCRHGHERIRPLWPRRRGCWTCGVRPGNSSIQLKKLVARGIADVAVFCTQVQRARELNATRRRQLLELWRKIAGLEQLEGTLMRALGFL